jgi:hypothetical protein
MSTLVSWHDNWIQTYSTNSAPLICHDADLYHTSQNCLQWVKSKVKVNFTPGMWSMALTEQGLTYHSEYGEENILSCKETNLSSST